MATDIVPQLSASLGGGEPSWGTAPYTGAHVAAGGIEFGDAEPPPPVALHCTERKSDGAHCLAYQSGDDGMCVGHRKRRLSQAS